MSSIIIAAMADMRASVYRMAAGGQPGDRAEVPLLVDQHVPHVPFLGHADQGGIDHALAVRMVVAAGVAGDFRALDPAGPRREVQVVHGDQDSPLRGLQPVAHVGQRPADDHAHRVGQIAALQFVLDGDVQQPLRGQAAGGRRGRNVGRGILGHRAVREGDSSRSTPRVLSKDRRWQPPPRHRPGDCGDHSSRLFAIGTVYRFSPSATTSQRRKRRFANCWQTTTYDATFARRSGNRGEILTRCQMRVVLEKSAGKKRHNGSSIFNNLRQAGRPSVAAGFAHDGRSRSTRRPSTRGSRVDLGR